MYSTSELIKISAKKGMLNSLFAAMMSDIPQKHVTILDASQTNLADILSKIDENDLLVTNDDYVNEKCDYQVITKIAKVILQVNEDGSTVNYLDQQEYLEDTQCEELSKIYDEIKHCCNICIVQEAT